MSLSPCTSLPLFSFGLTLLPGVRYINPPYCFTVNHFSFCISLFSTPPPFPFPLTSPLPLVCIWSSHLCSPGARLRGTFWRDSYRLSPVRWCVDFTFTAEESAGWNPIWHWSDPPHRGGRHCSSVRLHVCSSSRTAAPHAAKAVNNSEHTNWTVITFVQPLFSQNNPCEILNLISNGLPIM